MTFSWNSFSNTAVNVIAKRSGNEVKIFISYFTLSPGMTTTETLILSVIVGNPFMPTAGSYASTVITWYTSDTSNLNPGITCMEDTGDILIKNTQNSQGAFSQTELEIFGFEICYTI